MPVVDAHAVLAQALHRHDDSYEVYTCTPGRSASSSSEAPLSLHTPGARRRCLSTPPVSQRKALHCELSGSFLARESGGVEDDHFSSSRARTSFQLKTGIDDQKRDDFPQVFPYRPPSKQSA